MLKIKYLIAKGGVDPYQDYYVMGVLGGEGETIPEWVECLTENGWIFEDDILGTERGKEVEGFVEFARQPVGVYVVTVEYYFVNADGPYAERMEFSTEPMEE